MAVMEANTEPKGKEDRRVGQSDGKLLDMPIIFYYTQHLSEDPHKGGWRCLVTSSQEWWEKQAIQAEQTASQRQNFAA